MFRDRLARFSLGFAFLLAAVLLAPFAVNAQDATATPADPLAAEPSAFDETPEALGMAGEGAGAALLDVDGNSVGQVSISTLGDGLMMVQVSATGLPAGFHGFHIHTTGACDPSGDEPFSSAGGHLNPNGASHPEHAGDLPVLYVTAGGAASMALVTDRFTLDQLFDDDGAAFIVHGNANNYANIPERYGGPDEETLNAGDSGPRIACGVVEGAGMDMMATEEAAG